MTELEELKQRVALLEDFVLGLRDNLKKFSYGQGRLEHDRAQAALPHDLLRVPASTPPKGNPVATNDARVLSDQMVERFKQATGTAYVFEGAKDAAAIQRLVRLKFEHRDELLARWEEAVKRTAYPGTKSIAVFATRVNEFGAGKKAANSSSAFLPSDGSDPYGV